jgi:hypothetical protein
MLDAYPTLVFQLHGDTASNSNLQQVNTNSTEITAGLASSLDPLHPLDVLVTFPPSHYMLYNRTIDMYIPVILFTATDKAIFGANFMKNHDVLFDVENDRLGWAESDCNESTGTTTPVPTPHITPAPIATPLITPAPTTTPQITPAPTHLVKPNAPPSMFRTSGATSIMTATSTSVKSFISVISLSRYVQWLLVCGGMLVMSFS